MFSLKKVFSLSGMVLFPVIIVTIFAAIFVPSFRTTSNMDTLLMVLSMNGILAIGMSFVLLSGGMDLSIGSLMAITTVIAASYIKKGGSPVIGLLIPVMIGLFVGLINKTGITKLKLPPFIMTLAMAIILRGAAFQYTDGTVIGMGELTPSFIKDLAFPLFGFIPVSLFLFIFLFAVGTFILARTYFGRCIYVIGNNPENARLLGIRVGRHLTLVYAIAGVLFGFGALIWLSRTHSGAPGTGAWLELKIIAMVVLGGNSLSGGEGNLWKTLMGVLLLTLLNDIIGIMGLNPLYKDILVGAMLLLAIASQRVTLFSKESTAMKRISLGKKFENRGR